MPLTTSAVSEQFDVGGTLSSETHQGYARCESVLGSFDGMVLLLRFAWARPEHAPHFYTPSCYEGWITVSG